MFRRFDLCDLIFAFLCFVCGRTMGLGIMQKLKESWRAGLFVIGRHVSDFSRAAYYSPLLLLIWGAVALRVPSGSVYALPGF